MKKHIHVIDSPVGSGKTSWAIQYINELPDHKKVLFITPFRDEVHRIIDGCELKNIHTPKENPEHKNKSINILHLIERGENIASTHSLFLKFNDKLLKLLEKNKYILILDEVADVITKYSFLKAHSKKVGDVVHDEDIKKDMKYFIEEEILTIGEDYKIHVNKLNMLSQYENFIVHARSGCLYYLANIIYWVYSPAFFSNKYFSEINILTFQFKNQLQHYYFDYFDIDYDFYKIIYTENNKGRQYSKIKSDNNKQELDWINQVKDLVNFDEANRSFNRAINKVSWIKSGRPLSLNWYEKPENEEYKKLLFKSVRSFFSNVGGNNSNNKDETNKMWTCYKDHRIYFMKPGKKKGNRVYSSHIPKEGFVAYNIKALNKHRNKTVLAYLINRLPSPDITNFFNRKEGINFRKDDYALSFLIQWIWRSAIRDNKPINIYIPSPRMKRILKDYLGK